MNIDEEINAEYKKIEIEKKINETVLDNTKKKFAEEILLTNLGNELRNCNAYNVRNKYKIKLPLKIRIKNFLNKIKNVLGYGS